MNSTKNEVFGTNLKMLRAGRSQKEMANLLGFKNYQSYQRYEAGNVPNQKRLGEMASRLNVLAKDLLYSRLTVVAADDAQVSQVAQLTRESARLERDPIGTARQAPASIPPSAPGIGLPWTEGSRLDIDSWARAAGMPVDQFILDCVRTHGETYAEQINLKREALRTDKIAAPHQILYQLEPESADTDEFVDPCVEPFAAEDNFDQPAFFQVPEPEPESKLEPVAEVQHPVAPEVAPPPPVGNTSQDEHFMVDAFERWADSLIRSLKNAPKRWSDGRVKHAPGEFLEQIILFYRRVSALSNKPNGLHLRCSMLFDLAEKHVSPHFSGVENSPVDQLQDLYHQIAFPG
jgi:hypothetical protein